MRCATFNVLADAYIGNGDYSHVDPELLLPHRRIRGIVQLLQDLDSDIIGLQEAEEPLVQALDETGDWQSLWSPRTQGEPDGCLTLVRRGIDIHDFETHPYSNRSGHILQLTRIGHIVFANTHLKWAAADAPDHPGAAQALELLEHVGERQPAVILGDCNDRPNGPVRELVKRAGFLNVYEDEPTAFVNQLPAALDLLAVRGIAAKRVSTKYRPHNIPSSDCPSDHIPVVAELEIVGI